MTSTIPTILRKRWPFKQKKPNQFPFVMVVDKPPRSWEDWVKKHATPTFDHSKTGERLDQRKRREAEETLGLDNEPA